MKRVLVLFPNEWDHLEFSAARYQGRYRFYFEGFDLHKFPENARLLTFDALRFIDGIIAKYSSLGLSAVVSNEEQFGTVIASVVADRLGLPTASPQSVLTCQHKYYARVRAQRVVPEATPEFTVFPYEISRESEVGAAFPLFVKPVKATYSILARRVDNFHELRKLLTFRPLETLILKKLVQPADDLAKIYCDFSVDTRHLIGEQIVGGAQVTVDGFVDHAKVRVLGIVDSHMYPGTNAFQRFEYPSKLPGSIQRRMTDLIERLIPGLGFTHGLFNVELAYDSDTDDIKIIEVNPRLAYQFADLYEKVDGCNPYDILLDLACGQTPRFELGQGVYRNAASFVLRAFPGSKLKGAPKRADLESVRRQNSDARVMVYIKRGSSLAREFKWLGSYRYAVLNIGAKDHHDLQRRFHSVRDKLPFVFS